MTASARSEAPRPTTSARTEVPRPITSPRTEAPRPLAQRPWVGVNFWSRAGGPRMWSERYSPEVVREELDVLIANGCNVTRCFCYWPDFMPAPERLDPAVLDRFLDFLQAHRERGLGTIPTFIVGHMSGENWDPSWRGDRDLYRDVWLVGQQAWFVAEVGRRFATHPAVSGWLLSNEMPLYGDAGATEEEVTAWARLLMHALRAAGADQPASVGDGAWGIETSGHDNGFSLRRLAPIVDFLGPHVYPMSDDPVRHHSVAALSCLLAASFHRPVVLEEFGVTSDFASDENAAHYYRQVLHSTLVAGAEGWIAWNNCDFDDLADEDPYRHHPFELHFGLTDRHGAAKPALEELARFSAMLTELPAASLAARTAPQACLVVPEHFERRLPFTVQADRDDLRDILLQAYVAGREADLRLGIERERDGLSPATRLFLLPCAKMLTAPGMASLRERAAAGATVYLSYFPGSTTTQRGPWLYRLEETFGVRHALRYGLLEPLSDTEVTLTFRRAFGAIAEGEQLVFRIPPGVPALTRLPVEPLTAEVVATDGHGRPALLSHPLGGGTGVLCTYSLEYMAARTPLANPEPTWRLYDALAGVAGVNRPLRCADPRVSCAVTGGDGSLASVTNLSGEHAEVEVLHHGSPPLRLSLAPYDVHTFVHPTYQ